MANPEQEDADVAAAAQLGGGPAGSACREPGPPHGARPTANSTKAPPRMICTAPSMVARRPGAASTPCSRASMTAPLPTVEVAAPAR